MKFTEVKGELNFSIVQFPIYGWNGSLAVIFIEGRFASCAFMPAGVDICRAGGGWTGNERVEVKKEKV